MQKSCGQCQSQFETVQEDLDFYKKIDVPEPDYCPTCRAQRRAAFRNEKSLYSRKCDLWGYREKWGAISFNYQLV